MLTTIFRIHSQWKYKYFNKIYKAFNISVILDSLNLANVSRNVVFCVGFSFL